MELRGDFTSYSEILDLLQIVSIGKKTGEVLLNTNGKSITIQIKDGKIVNFKTNIQFLDQLRKRVINREIPLSEAVKFILHLVAMWEKGRFSFQEKSIGDETLGSVDTLTVMMDFTKEQDELPDELKELFKKNPYFILSEEIDNPVTLDTEDWKLLSLISKGKSLERVIFSKSNSFKEGLEKINNFLETGLIHEVKNPEEQKKEIFYESKTENFVDEQQLEKIRELLIETMGPMGEFLIEETFEDMGISKLPDNMIDSFVVNLLEKIPDSCFIEGESCRERLKEEITSILKGGAHGS